MARDPGERRSVRQSQIAVQEHENLVCPRCESTNTKFCYYNNYNLSQPRYFCKSCRRYWTHGGSLRNIPVGGGSRATKRSRTTTSSPSSSSSSSSSASLSVSPATISASDISANLSFKGGSFMSLLGTPAPPGFLGLGEPVLGRAGREGFELVDDVARNGMDTWQDGSGDGEDCFGWPGFARKTFSSG